MPDHDDRPDRHDFDQLRAQPGDYERPLDPVADAPPVSRAAWVGLIVLFVAVAVGLWFWLREVTPTPAATPGASAGLTPAASEPPAAASGLGIGDPDPALPSLDDLDAHVRPLLAVLSRRPELAALLATDDLVRRFVVSIETISRGGTPARQVAAVAPRSPFGVRTDAEGPVTDPRSYARYDGLVRLVDDLDADQLARLYGRLKPRLEDAHAELGVAGSLDATMTRALAHLLETPEVPATARLRQGKGTNYVYADPTIERLSPAQRQVLRLGPDGARRVKATLRAFATALGVPPDRLPPSR